MLADAGAFAGAFNSGGFAFEAQGFESARGIEGRAITVTIPVTEKKKFIICL
jgi:hypothetical protein